MRYTKRLMSIAAILTAMLCCTKTAMAADIVVPNSTGGTQKVWYALGDTVSLGFPRIAYTRIDKQITKSEYDAISNDEQKYTETSGTTTYYFSTNTYRDSIMLIMGAQPNQSGVYQEVTGMNTEVTSMNDLWYLENATDTLGTDGKYNPYVYVNMDNVRMRVKHLASGKYLHYDNKSTGTIVLDLVDASQASTFGMNIDESAPFYHFYDHERATDFIPLLYDQQGKKMFFQSASDGIMTTTEGSKEKGTWQKIERSQSYKFVAAYEFDYYMRCFQWTRENNISFSITASPYSPSFGYAANQTSADKQAITQEISVSLIDSTQLYNVYARNNGYDAGSIKLSEPVSIDDAAELQKKYGIRAQFYWGTWKGDTLKMNSVLETKQIDNTLSNIATYQDEKSRDMFVRETATQNGKWYVKVTPQGRSPFNVIDTTKQYAGSARDYIDNLVCELLDDGNHVLADHQIQYVRKAYNVQARVDSTLITVNDAAPTVSANGGSLEVKYNILVYNDTIRYTAGGAIDSIYSSKSTRIELSDKGFATDKNGNTITNTLTYQILDQDGNVVDYLGKTTDNTNVYWDHTKFDANNSTTTIVFPNQNLGNATKTYILYVEGYYYGHFNSYRLTINQLPATGTEGKIKFSHSKGGYSDYITNKNSIQYQKVHTIEKTIYYTAGETIELLPNEPNMDAYWRWYDYDTDMDPRYYLDGTYIKTTDNFWQVVPKAVGGATFKTINLGTKGSRGYYASKQDGYGFPSNATDYSQWSNMIPQIKGWSDGQSRNIALDASNYADYTITDTTIVEPTLSYRQIWHLRPASEMADSLEKCTSAEKAYEYHEYMAPTGKTVYLRTKFVHKNDLHHESERCYWFYGTSNGTKTLLAAGSTTNGTPQWKYRTQNSQTKVWGAWTNMTGDYENDLVKVSSSTAGTYEYAVYIPGKTGGSKVTYSGDTLYIARFKVTYASPATYGPSTDELISADEMKTNYDLLATQDFDFGTAAGSLSTSSMVFRTTPLNADNSTYGFLYVDESGNPQRNRTNPTYNSKNFPYFGEYTLVNQLKNAAGTTWWIDAEQHGGAANGYMLYVDGKKEPGLIATISTDVTLCEGQQMYCSAWVRNPSNNSSNTEPIIRFDVQGRNSESEEWKSAASFFMGNLENYSGWQQVNFPVVSEESYKYTQIAIYDFANNNSGNDVLIDDINLYATQLPLSAYQVFTSCDVEDMTAVVAAIDYDNTTEGSQGTIYYSIVNTKADTTVCANYHFYSGSRPSSSWNHKYGIITVPKNGYDPSKSGTTEGQSVDGDETNIIFASVTAMMDSLENRYNKDKQNGTIEKYGYNLKGYVKTTDKKLGEHYIMYIAHLVPQDYVPTSSKYQLNMAAKETELLSPKCSMSADLPISQKAQATLGGSTEAKVGLCANGLYPITVKVNNTIQIKDATGKETSVDLTTYCKSDWLVGYAFDTVYATGYGNSTSRAAADEVFKATYGYDRGKVIDALEQLRRYENTVNYTAANIDVIVTDTINNKTGKPETILSDEHYAIITDLYKRNLLKLYQDSDQVYLRSQDTIYYWVYPIQGTAKATYNGTVYTLDNCSNKTFLWGMTDATNYTLNVAPMSLDKMTAEQRHSIPRVRVSQGKANTTFSVPISDMSSNGLLLGWDSCKVISSTDPEVQALIDSKAPVSKFSMRYTQDRIYATGKTDYYNATTNNTIKFTPIDEAHIKTLAENDGFHYPNTHKMRAGYEYTMSLTMLNSNHGTQSENTSCPVGTVYFTVVVVPDTVVWTGRHSDYWGDDNNWEAIIDGKRSENGYVPLAETNVVLPQKEDKTTYPYLCDSVFYPMDAHYVTTKCHKILFQNTATLLNQQKLQYDSAYVDLVLNPGQFYAIGAPLKDVYSGDFYVPHSGSSYSDASAKSVESTDLFTVSSFQGFRGSNAPFAAWATYYNDTVGTKHISQTGDYIYEGNTLINDTVGIFWSKSNTYDKKIEPISGGIQVGVWGPDNYKDSIAIRLPKPDKQYNYYYNGSKTEFKTDELERSNAHKFAFEPDENGKMTVTLHNDQASCWFLFSNPTMAYLDAEAFLYTNINNIESYYLVLDADGWKARTRYNVTYSTRFLRPFQSVLIYARGGVKKKELTVTLDVNHLAISNVEGARTNYEGTTDVTRSINPTADTRHKAPVNGNNGHYLQNGTMHIAAFVRSDEDEAVGDLDLVAVDFANDGYDQTDDVRFISTGIQDDGTTTNGATAVSEMNIYSMVDKCPLMVDVREEIGIVPLGFLISNDKRTEYNGKMNLFFSLTDWNQECYLVDSYDGTKTRITDCKQITIDMPQNHEMRYYIQGPKVIDDDKTTTDNSNVVITPESNDASSVSIYSKVAGQVNIIASSAIASVRLYDATGRTLVAKTVNNGTPVLTIAAPAGILIAEVTLQNGTIARSKVFVE